LTTFDADLRSVRLRNAADLLAHQPLTVADVARLVGYREPSQFVKVFRQRYETSPGAFGDRAQALHHSRSLVVGPTGLALALVTSALHGGCCAKLRRLVARRGRVTR
jgi:AraC-like DNA-binding protein